MLSRLCFALLLLPVAACGNDRTTAPSPTAASSTTFSLRGIVSGGTFTDAVRTPIAGATLFIIDGPDVGRSVTTDASGKYIFTGLRPSGFTVSVSAGGYLPRSEGVTLISNQTLDVQLTQPPAAIMLTGRVIDAATSTPIAGAVVSINGRYQGTADGAGNYSVNGRLDAGANTDFTYVSANGYASDYRHIRGATQNVRLYRIDRIMAGESKVVTVDPDDTLCVNNLQDEPGIGPEFVCRSIRVVATRAGVMTVEALSQDGERPPLEVEVDSEPVDWNPPPRNPTSPFAVSSGTEVVVNVEMPSSSHTSRSFVVNTSISPR